MYHPLQFFFPFRQTSAPSVIRVMDSVLPSLPHTLHLVVFPKLMLYPLVFLFVALATYAVSKEEKFVFVDVKFMSPSVFCQTDSSPASGTDSFFSHIPSYSCLWHFGQSPMSKHPAVSPVFPPVVWMLYILPHLEHVLMS